MCFGIPSIHTHAPVESKGRRPSPSRSRETNFLNLFLNLLNFGARVVGLMGYEQAKLRGAASYVSWVVTRTLSLTTRQSARRDPYGRLPDALGMCDDL